MSPIIFSLYLKVCLATSLHGAPATTCQTIQKPINAPTITKCFLQAPKEISEFMAQGEATKLFDLSDLIGVACLPKIDPEDKD